MELLDYVKTALGETGAFRDNELKYKIEAVKQLIGLPDKVINSELGGVLVAICVNDLSNLESGEVQTSKAYSIIWEKLYNESLKLVEENEKQQN